MKKSIAAKVREDLDKNKRESIQKTVEGIKGKMMASSATIHATLQREIDSVRTQVEQILRDKQDGEQANNQKKHC